MYVTLAGWSYDFVKMCKSTPERCVVPINLSKDHADEEGTRRLLGTNLVKLNDNYNVTDLARGSPTQLPMKGFRCDVVTNIISTGRARGSQSEETKARKAKARADAAFKAYSCKPDSSVNNFTINYSRNTQIKRQYSYKKVVGTQGRLTQHDTPESVTVADSGWVVTPISALGALPYIRRTEWYEVPNSRPYTSDEVKTDDKLPVVWFEKVFTNPDSLEDVLDEAWGDALTIGVARVNDEEQPRWYA
jgi:hypothetical protein